MRIVFMGTPDFAVPTLRAVLAARLPGRRRLLARPAACGARHGCAGLAVHAWPRPRAFRVLTPPTLRDEAAAATRPPGHGADVAMVAAYGLILPPARAGGPAPRLPQPARLALPRWRGAAPDRARRHGRGHRHGRYRHADGGGPRYGAGVPAEPVAIGPDMTAGRVARGALAQQGRR